MFKEDIVKISSEFFFHCKTIDNRYKCLKKLGEGRYGKVYLCFDTYTEKLIALKLLRSNSIRSKLYSFLEEISILVKLKKFQITQLKVAQILEFNLHGCFQNQKPAIYYTMEFIELGEFYDFIENSALISESTACYFFIQILDQLQLIHQKNIFHMDLKPENVLVNLKGELFLCDFGSCYQGKFSNKLKKFRFNGTQEYQAPEIHEILNIQQSTFNKETLQNLDFSKIDIFSLGVILFLLVLKSLPFNKANYSDKYYKKFLTDKKFYWNIFKNIRSVSDEFKLFIEALLSPNGSQRLSRQQILQHKWIKKNKNNFTLNFDTYFGNKKENFLISLKKELQQKYYIQSKNSLQSKHKEYKQECMFVQEFSDKHQKKIQYLKQVLNSSREVSSKSFSEHSNVSDNLPTEFEDFLKQFNFLQFKIFQLQLTQFFCITLIKVYIVDKIFGTLFYYLILYSQIFKTFIKKIGMLECSFYDNISKFFINTDPFAQKYQMLSQFFIYISNKFIQASHLYISQQNYLT